MLKHRCRQYLDFGSVSWLYLTKRKTEPMKIVRFTFALTLLFCFVATASARPGDDKVVVKVENIVGNEKNAEKLTEQLKKIEGIDGVSACTVSGNVTISYDNSKLANTDAVFSALDARGVKYAKAGGCCAKGAAGTKASCNKDNPSAVKTENSANGKSAGCCKAGDSTNNAKAKKANCKKPCDKTTPQE